MNLIPKIAEMLGVEIGEEFKIQQATGDIKSAKYRFRNIGDQIIYERTDICGDWTMCSAEEAGLLVLGKHEIVKLPYKPKPQERFFFVSTTKPVTIEKAYWSSNNNTIDYALLFCGNVFRTEEEAEKHKAEIYEKLIGEKWGEG